MKLIILLLLTTNTFAGTDLNGDGMVTVIDFLLFRPMINTVNFDGDYNCDGFVTITDFLIMRSQMNGPPNPTGLSWTAPTLNDDGTPLTDLAGFKVYCGSGQWAVNDPTVTRWCIDPILTGEFSCVVTAYDATGNESRDSNVVAVTR